MQELASVSRVRDYINHLESKVSRETVVYLTHTLKQHLNEVYSIEAQMQTETWTVITKMGTTIFNVG